MDEPAVSVVIPTYRDMAFVVEAVPRLLASTAVALDVVIVNNDPDQPIGAWVAAYADPRVRVIEVGFNSGFMGATNRGIAATSAPYVFFHNADLVVTPDHISRLVSFLREHPRAACAAGKVLKLDPATRRPLGVIDSAGIEVRRSRATHDRGEGERDAGQFDRAEQVFAVSGAALLVRRSALEDIRLGSQYLDELLFMYRDDFDLGWRLRQRGWECWYVPAAVAYHVRSSTGLAGRSYLLNPHHYFRAMQSRSEMARLYSLRNQWIVLLKNDRWGDLVRDAPYIFVREILVVGVTALTSPRLLARATASFLRAVPVALRERREIRARAIMPPGELRRWFTGGAARR